MSNLRDAKPRIKTITLRDGVEREISLTLNAMAELEDKFGSVDKAFEAMDKGSIKATRFVLWAALQVNGDESLTEQRVGDLIDMNIMADVMQAISAAAGEDLPEKLDGQAPNA